MTGKVYLVGAGPGDPGLFTLKGKAVLERADSVIYDVLANEALLRFARPDCEKICVAELGPRRTTRHRETVKLLIAKAQNGQIVARLKGGDPFIFGRGGEEALELVKAGIPFEVVPGISAGYAAPAYAGIPVTHRGLASSVAVIAGHEYPEKEGGSVDWEKVCNAADTLVFFMGVRNLAEIAAALAKHGRAPETPVTVIHWGTRAEQKIATGTLLDIAAKAAGFGPPAVIVVGEVVKLRDQLNWFERRPLFGKRIAITRAREQAGVLAQALADLGAQTVEIPTIEIRPPQSWKPLDRAIKHLEDFDYLLVTSVNGVKSFLARLMASGRDVRDLKGLTIGAIGPATAAEFAKTRVRVDFVPREYRAEGLLEALADRDLRGKAFLIPRPKVARNLVPRALAERGARVEVIPAYETTQPSFGPGELERLLTPLPDLITFTSSSTASNFVKLLEAHKIGKALAAVALASIGPITSDTMRKLGLEVAVEAAESTMPGLVRAIQGYFGRPAR
jgi:uroporphyrinogen III methyltransferase / synthase